ncbi:Hsp20/alpha crystallin family protein [Polyangium jinanense]|uniref:Hsp20/alpha crystallin family protein n=1 Tax=Polyangium jinanense TaxID=2829994 RepID=A0A9X4ARJ1_9BACT|nr:Hsp20/alpha crystallin family protein [Polyangium jinanense]MDC3952584.1 Hsp20/alpha crystallin family protein [Polyangium jinanense]MDC3980212.1 Hsp20/alpha crystallin family protein [Polyangium jinanense]
MLMRFGDVNRTFAAMDELRRRMDRLFDEYDSRGGAWPRSSFFFEPFEAGLASRTVATWPRLSVYDKGDALVIAADVPGMKESDIKLEIDQDVLTLSGERKADVPEGYAIHKKERVPVKFSRSVALPCKVDAEKASAVLKDGVLTLTLTKSPEAQPRKIAVKSAS